MPRSGRLGLASLVFGFASALAAGPALGQQSARGEIRGLVMTPSEVPLSGSEIVVVGDSLSVISDSGGRFVLRGIPPGQHVIRVRRIGYLAQYLAATLVPGEVKDVVITLTPGAYRLPEVEVTARLAKPIEYAWTTKYDDFFRRQRVGLGRYITRKDIDRKPATQTAELLVGVPGIWIRFGAPGLTPNGVKATRCRKMSVWVDGWELRPDPITRPMMGDPRNPAEQVGVLLERIIPLQIEMIEVYTSPSRMQAEFLGNSDCAIVIWTR